MKIYLPLAIIISSPLLVSMAGDTVIPPKSLPSLSEKIHNEWLLKHIDRIKTIKKGSTRAEFNKLFSPTGGYRSKETYQYKKCSVIRVEVEFNHINKGEISDKDTIVEISRPFLDASQYYD